VGPEQNLPAKEAEMKEDGQQHILAGFSGSQASLTALRWAIDEARLRRADLQVVRVWDPARHAAPYASAGQRPACDEQETAARAGLAAAMRAAFGPAVPDGVSAEVSEGRPERVLVARSAAADLLVIGEAKPPWRAGQPAGPVVRACLAHASCPVVIVGSAAGRSTSARRKLAGASA
jgi:nucleotide-binding universal stress UspA family protein